MLTTLTTMRIKRGLAGMLMGGSMFGLLGGEVGGCGQTAGAFLRGVELGYEMETGESLLGQEEELYYDEFETDETMWLGGWW